MKPFYIFGVSFLLASCAVGPNYQQPDVTNLTPAQWKWQTAAPRDTEPRGDWWTIFKDSELNRLESLAVAQNQELKVAMARVDQSRAIIGLSSAAFIPTLSVDGSVKREQTSGNSPSPVPITIPPSRINTFNLPLQLSYEIDLWGRVRRSIESAKADAEATAANYHSVLLTLTGDVAANYFLIRSSDSELAALRGMLSSQQKTINLIQQRFEAGTIPEADFARARSELATTKADLADVKRAREESVNVLALLCGQPASTFTLKERSISGRPPTIPAGVPASLLERRPDIAMAERRVAARNAEIGVAVAGYFPTVSLTGQGGYLSNDAETLFKADSKVWSIGPSISVPITGFFVTKAKVAQARAIREEAIANYRLAVLTGIKDVETSLSQIKFRREQSIAQDEALSAAVKATDLTRQLYEGGTISFLELLDAERTSLARERQSAQVKAQSYIASVRLIKALGGAW